MKCYNSLENVNSKKTMQSPKNLQRKVCKKDHGMIEDREESRKMLRSAFERSDHKSWEQQS